MTARFLPMLALVCALGLTGLVRNVQAEGGQVTVEVDPREVYLGQSLTLRVLVAGDASAVIDLPEFPDCTVTPRGRVHGTRGEGGEPVTAYRFELTPRRVGECRVPALRVQIAGETVVTDPIAVRVLSRPTPPKGLAGRDILLDAVASRDAPYVGESFVYTLRLYRAVAVASVNLAPPEAPGLTIAPLPGQRDGEIEVAGRRYAVTDVDYLVTPLRPGRLAVPPAKAVFRGVTAKAGPSKDVLTVSGPELAVAVRPLPPYDGAASFTGLVGRLELAARLDDDAASAGRDAVYVLTLSGQGNLREAAPPDLSLPPGLVAHLLPPEGESGAARPDAAGERVFRYALTAAKPGDYVVPGPTLAVFDPETGRYRVLVAKALSLHVGPAAPTDPALAPPLRHDPQAPDAAPPSWPWRASLALLPLAIYGSTFLPGPKRRKAKALAVPAPSALAEALRQALDRATDRRTDAWQEGAEALGRLDRLLYAGEPAGPADLEAALDQAGQALRRLGP